MRSFKLQNMASATTLLISLLAVLVFTSSPIPVVHGCGINIVNKCSYSVTTCAQSGSDAISQYQIGAGGSQNLDFGSACKWPSAAVWASITGQCAKPAGSASATDKNLANLAEFNIGPSGGLDFYDLSNVNAYTIGLGISVTSSAGGQCTTIQCSIADIRSFCVGNNKLESESSGALSCINTDGTAGIGPTVNTKYFKTACPQAYSYNYDDATSTFTCNTGSSYQVTFCP